MPVKVEHSDPSGSRVRPKGLTQKIAFALDSYPCECLFVHRDAEKEPADKRRSEIQQALESLGPTKLAAHICVIPVRMSEAWLLFDELAIRLASGNPNGKVRLEIPRLAETEGEPDPKRLLHDLLTTASELTDRRRRTFDFKACSRRVAELIDDFAPLRGLSAFQALERDVSQLVRENRWDGPPNRRS